MYLCVRHVNCFLLFFSLFFFFFLSFFSFLSAASCRPIALLACGCYLPFFLSHSHIHNSCCAASHFKPHTLLFLPFFICPHHVLLLPRHSHCADNFKCKKKKCKIKMPDLELGLLLVLGVDMIYFQILFSKLLLSPWSQEDWKRHHIIQYSIL